MYSTWLDQHLEEFVRPYLGKVPDIKQGGNWETSYWQNKDRVRDLINIWKKTRECAGGRKILLTGRDMFLMFVVAQMLRDVEGVEFRPEISRQTMHHIKEDYTEHFLLDTGFSGSIPKALRMEHWRLIQFNGTFPKMPKSVGCKDWQDPKYIALAGEYKATKQLPATDPAWDYNIVARMENTSKYWESGYLTAGNMPTIALAHKREFEEAAKATILVAHGVVPPPVRRGWLFPSKSIMWRY